MYKGGGNMKILGILFIIAGIALGAYLGIYLMLFGGIMQVVNALDPLNAKEIAIGAIRILFCEVGMVPVILGSTIGFYLISED